MTIRRYFLSAAFLSLFAAAVPACGSDDGESEAQRHGVGSACAKDLDCTEEGQSCLAFKGGYCGVANCTGDKDCPGGSACVAHDDGKNYCFLICVEKVDCNVHRDATVEANCSANITFVSGDKSHKACVPPSG